MANAYPRQNNAARADEAILTNARMNVQPACPIMGQKDRIQRHVTTCPDMDTNRKSAVQPR